MDRLVELKEKMADEEEKLAQLSRATRRANLAFVQWLMAAKEV